MLSPNGFPEIGPLIRVNKPHVIIRIEDTLTTDHIHIIKDVFLPIFVPMHSNRIEEHQIVGNFIQYAGIDFVTPKLVIPNKVESSSAYYEMIINAVNVKDPERLDQLGFPFIYMVAAYNYHENDRPLYSKLWSYGQGHSESSAIVPYEDTETWFRSQARLITSGFGWMSVKNIIKNHFHPEDIKQE